MYISVGEESHMSIKDDDDGGGGDALQW